MGFAIVTALIVLVAVVINLVLARRAAHRDIANIISRMDARWR
jgi:predicted CDP-diglyceride synthetase/phosphatidate cytidylyltransferase